MDKPTRKRHFKDEVFAQLASIGSALSSPKRLELLDLLAQGEQPVEMLARKTGMSVANTSHHLQVLRRARLIDSRREGTFIHYALGSARVGRFYLELQELARNQLGELRQVLADFVKHRDQYQGVDREELLRQIRSGEAIVIDVRPPEEYRAGHISGARSVPLPELERRLSELPRDQRVIAYCRGPFCVMAVEAVEILRARGFEAQRLDDGVLEWRANGLPLELGGS